MTARRILVISYPFPPMPTVGGNRWLAMSKYLRRAGYEVEILTTGAFGARARIVSRGAIAPGPDRRALAAAMLRRPPLPRARDPGG